MKKLIIAAIFLISTSGILSAQNTKSGNTSPGTNKNCPGYVDANKNQVCDNYENRTCANAGKGPGQGQGKNCGYGKGNGQCSQAMQGRGNGSGNRRKGC